MIQQDFLMRAIQSLVNAFSRAIAVQDDAPEAALDEVEEALGDLFKTRPELLSVMPLDDLETTAPELGGELGRLFALRAELSLDLGEPVKADTSVRWAVEAYRRALQKPLGPLTLEAEERLIELLRSEVMRAFAEPKLVADAYETLFDFAARSSRLAAAEDAFFAAYSVGTTPEFVGRGREVFAAHLDRGEWSEEFGLTREEVAEVVREIDEIEV